ncbi:MAG: hypothetical protein UV61_C0002G0185 [Candidatus Gottesmanbacteria bacterium GW2011_GWB1_43_11]|uniref:Spore protein YkvP/CgeB glycosyl transferase-like domain-containing protein n=1 Tax=Candidatus Gottesmanbacteria bacterium GW2011_GWB1_43_11 TaxID=1618446 RepID=A0A0G1CPH4_9BACT|nr:MAG: hypothetical protein UV04_C0001G0073 [Candidatus Gottesmanbacteria bacterium GW2011_GWA2_42_16]KKS56262.1 MAG: hypothetical protein UV17_C0001G0072 [Candidatus Gottesmanbacteria bacterium GW2011_GWA1_42_26]KKS82595.1 MAG: hypothetical protein UV55_C0001G0055 [Candidatus Gottesmanbacteria bacterium GW2011_GWC1_43_10]KKS87464.1 MAG: hypothetical protein UV61_C0002G0185 [Candidatus Gottesmanbacteria bacterium GW2011_GWB1_43_11]OGG10161.1 MAG: hypothetical protein A2699_01280 [Candidatus Go
MSQTKILFVSHSLSAFTKPVFNNLQTLDFSVQLFDYYSPNIRSKILGLLKNVSSRHSDLEKLINASVNQDFINKAVRFKPKFILLFKAKNIYPETISNLRQKGFIVINWFPDYYDDWNWIRTHAANYDYFFTPCEYVQAQLKKLGVTSYYLPFAADADPTFRQTPKKYQATFVGRFTKRRNHFFQKVLTANLLDVWGYSHWVNSIYKSVYHGEITPQKTKEIIRQSKITLNTLTATDNVPIISVNYRMFEATGVGGFVLSWYNHPLEEFFKIGHEIEVFKTPDEALAKTKFYLKNESAREKIARAGWKRTTKDHTYLVRLRDLIKHLKV